MRKVGRTAAALACHMAESLVYDGRYVFRHPATGRLLQLTDIPFAG